MTSLATSSTRDMYTPTTKGKSQRVVMQSRLLEQSSLASNEPLHLYLDPHYCASPHVMSAQDIGSAFFGLQNMTSKEPSVRRLLGSLAAAVEVSPAVLNAQALGNALYGLQSMSSDAKETRWVLAALTNKLHQMPCVHYCNGSRILLRPTHSSQLSMSRNKRDFSKSSATSNAKFILADSAAAQDPCRSAARRADTGFKPNTSNVLSYYGDPADFEFSGQNIGNALWGLRNMSVYALRPSFTPAGNNNAIDHPVESSTSSDISAASRKSHPFLTKVHYLEVSELLQALAVRIAQSRAQLSGQNIGNALYGLHAMNGPDAAASGAITLSIAEAGAAKSSGNAATTATTATSLSTHNLTRVANKSREKQEPRKVSQVQEVREEEDTMAPGIREVLAALAHKIVISTQPLSGLDIGNAFSPFRCIH